MGKELGLILASEESLADGERFSGTPPDLEAYARGYPEVAQILRTCSVGSLTYEAVFGPFPSWNLVQEPLNPGYTKGLILGRIPIGVFQFPNEHTKRITMIKGLGLYAIVEGQDTEQFIINIVEQITIPANSRFGIVCVKPIVYLCEYLK